MDDDDDARIPVHKDLQAWFAVDPVQWEPPQQPVWGKSLSDHVSQLLAHDDNEGGHWHLCLQHPLDLEHKPQENMKQSTRQIKLLIFVSIQFTILLNVMLYSLVDNYCTYVILLPNEGWGRQGLEKN